MITEEKEIKKEIKLAKLNESYHRKKMEYYQEEIIISKLHLKELIGSQFQI